MIEQKPKQFFVGNIIQADWCLQIQNNSLSNAGINKGDVAFIKDTSELQTNKIYAVTDKENHTAFLAIFRLNKLYFTMQREEFNCLDPIDVKVIGECVGIYKPLINSGNRETESFPV